MKSLYTPTSLSKAIISGFFFLLVLNLQAQLNFKWAVTQGSPETDPTGSCKTDDQGGLYTTLSFRDTADLDPGPGVNLVLSGEDEVFVLNKYTQEGEYLWSAQFRTKGDAGGQIAEIRNNRILLLVYYTDSLIYTHHTPWMAVNPGPTLAAISMNLEGQIISYRHIANTNDMYFSDFTTQPDGSILAGGGFGTSVTFNTPDSTRTLISNGSDDAFIAQFNDQMELEWITLFAGTGYDFTESVFVGENGHIYYAVIHDSTVVMQTNHGEVVSPAYGEDNAIFGWTLADGSIESAYIFGGDLGDQIRNIVADPDGNMYINGYYTGEVNFQHPSGQPVVYTDLEEGEGFIAKYNPNGFLDWARIFTNGEYGGIYTMRMHRNSHLYFSGSYNLVSDLDPGPDSLIYDGGYDGDLMFGKMSTAGDLEWVYSIEGYSDEGIRNFFPGTDDKVFVHGYYYGDLDCDPGPDSVGILTQGGSDLFLIGFTEENVITSTGQPTLFEVRIYPNPSTDHFVIQAESPIEHVAVYDLDGKTLQIPVRYENTSAVLQAYSLQTGIYLARIKTSSGFSSIKICKQ